MFAADLMRGEHARALSCYADRHGVSLAYFPSLTLTQAELGLLVGAAVAFALIPPRSAVARASRTQASGWRRAEAFANQRIAEPVTASM